MSDLLLDTMNPKQKAKEFKTVGKEIKSKDDAVKISALEKLAADPRYVTEGACILPLLEIMAPKKKTIEFVRTALDGLLTYLSPPVVEPVVDEEGSSAPVTAINPLLPPLLGLQTIHSHMEALDALNVLSVLLMYKDEVKKVKPPKVKKGETPPPPPPPPKDSELSIAIRRKSLQSIYLICNALAHPVADFSTEEISKLKLSFCSIEGIVSNLCSSISQAKARIEQLSAPVEPPPTVEGEEGEAAAAAEDGEVGEGEGEKEEEEDKEALLVIAKEEAGWALTSLALLACSDPLSCKTLLSDTVLEEIPSMVEIDESFVYPTLRIFDALIRQDSDDINGLSFMVNHGLLSTFYEVAATASHELVASLGSGEEVLPEVCDSTDRARMHLDHLDTVVSSLSHVAVKQQSMADLVAFTSENTVMLVKSIKDVALCPKTWQIMRTPVHSAFPLMKFLDDVCSLLSDIGAISADLRHVVCQSGAIDMLICLLEASPSVFSVNNASGEGEGECEVATPTSTLPTEESKFRLRRYVEKSVLALVMQSSDGGESSSNSNLRWTTCQQYITDYKSLGSSGDETSVSEGANEGANTEAEDVPAQAEAETETDTEPIVDGAEGDGVEAIAAAAEVATGAALNFSVDQLVNLLDTVESDEDLSNRTVRLLACLLQSTATPMILADKLGLNTTLTGKLAIVVKVRGQAVIASALAEAYKSSDDTIAIETTPVEGGEATGGEVAAEADAEGEAEAEGKEAIPTQDSDVVVAEAGTAESSDIPIDIVEEKKEQVVVDSCIPTALDSLYLALSILEILLETNIDHINTFCNEEGVVKVMSDLIVSTGPSGLQTNNTLLAETVTQVIDLRLLDWTPTVDNPDAAQSVSSELFRPLVFDLLTLIVGSYNRYKTYDLSEGDDTVSFPIAIDSKAPPPMVATADAVSSVCSLCTDACMLTLMQPVVYGVNEETHLAISLTNAKGAMGESEGADPLCPVAVFNPALTTLMQIVSAGTLGLDCALSAVASAGFASATPAEGEVGEDVTPSPVLGAMNLLKTYLLAVELPTAVSTTQPFEEAKGGGETREGEGEGNASEPVDLKVLCSEKLADFEWSVPADFQSTVDTEEGEVGTVVPCSVTNLLRKPELWPFVTLLSPALSVLSSTQYSEDTAATAVQIITTLCKDNVYNDVCQPVIRDVFSALIVSCGSSVALAGAFGPFGHLSAVGGESSGLGEVMVYLANRGSVCERHYRFIRATEAATALEAEGGGEEETSVDADGEGEGESKEGGAGGKKGADMPALMAEVDMTEYRLPSASLWTTLLCLPFDDLHEQTVGSSALISAIKGGHTALALALINNRVTVDQVDSFSTTPLVYALTLNNEAVVSALLATGADVDRIDPNGNPTLKHAFVCLTTSDLAIVMSKAPSVDSKVYYGHAALVPIVLESRPDAQVSDSEGNAPLHYALGLAKASLSIGGNIISIKGGAYVNMIHTNSDNSSDVHYSRSTILTTSIALLEAGVNVNFCNKDGITPLHIAAANSHVSLIQKFIEYKAAANVLDNNGFLPLHFFAACCPPETISGVQGIEMFEFLMGVSDNRDLNQLTYTDLRTEKSKEERQVYDIDNAFNDIFQEALLPSCIAKRRLASSSLLSATTSDKYNMLQLLMCGHVLGCSNITPFTVQSLSVLDSTGASSIDVESYHALARQERCKVIIYLLTEYLVSPKNDDGQEDTEDWRFVTRQFLLNDSIVESNFTIAHALSLLLQGESVRTPLTDQQKRSKKVKYYESEELQVIALMGPRFDTDCMNSACSTTISSIVWPSDIKNAWTPIHAIMSVNNGYLLSTVLEDIDMSDPLYSNLLEVFTEIISSNSSTNTSTCSTSSTSSSSTNTLSVEQRSSVFTVLLTAITKMKNYSDYLKPSLLYKAAIDLQSPALVSILIKCPQLNPNSLHESSPSDDAKCTALHQICTLIGSESDDSSSYYNVLDAFATNPDRLDLLVEDPYGNTCVDIAIQSRNFKLLKALVSMRKMDVIERLILSRYGGPSLLMELESENLQLAKDCGFAIQPFPAPLVAEAGIAIPTGEEVGEGKQQVEASVETMGVGSDMEIGGVSLTEDASLPMFTADDGGHAEITVVGSDNTTNSINPTTEQDMANLTRSNEAVYFVLELVGQLVGSDCHVDNCYYEGLVFSDYCDRVKKEMNEEMAKLESQTNEMVVNENTMESMPTEVEVEVTVS